MQLRILTEGCHSKSELTQPVRKKLHHQFKFTQSNLIYEPEKEKYRRTQSNQPTHKYQSNSFGKALAGGRSLGFSLETWVLD